MPAGRPERRNWRRPGSRHSFTPAATPWQSCKPRRSKSRRAGSSKKRYSGQQPAGRGEQRITLMSPIPNFAEVDFGQAKIPAGAAAAAPWLTPEGIAVKPLYGADDLKGLAFLHTYPGIAPYLRSPHPTMYVTQPST